MWTLGQGLPTMGDFFDAHDRGGDFLEDYFLDQLPPRERGTSTSERFETHPAKRICANCVRYQPTYQWHGHCEDHNASTDSSDSCERWDG